MSVVRAENKYPDSTARARDLVDEHCITNFGLPRHFGVRTHHCYFCRRLTRALRSEKNTQATNIAINLSRSTSRCLPHPAAIPRRTYISGNSEPYFCKIWMNPKDNTSSCLSRFMVGNRPGMNGKTQLSSSAYARIYI